jgi:hypothetical protein
MENSKVCERCGRSFLSEEDLDLICYVCKKEEEDAESFHEMALAEDEILDYVKRKEKEREKWMMSMIRNHLSLYDRFLFFFYKKLADRFGGGNKVVPVQKRDALNDTMFGITIYGKEYWYSEKETIDYESKV